MLRIIQVSFLSRVAYTCWVPAHNVEISTSIYAGFSMPLHLCWASIEHWRWENRYNCCVGVQNTLLEHLKRGAHPAQIN